VTSAPDIRPSWASKGVTLIELMIVLVVISIGLLALSGVQTSSSRDVDATGRHSHAIQLAKNQMEVARAAGYTLVVPDSGLSGPFTWNTAVTESVADPGLKTVVVSVTWTEHGRQRSVRLEDLLSSR
jgi:prepilin-type N-terminal cleavage/methylation domain-containing protein